MPHYLTRPMRIEAIQYDGDYTGQSMHEIRTALIRWFGVDGAENDDDARSYLGVSVHWRAEGEERTPLVHLEPGDPEHDCLLPGGSWLVRGEDGEITVMSDADFQHAIAPPGLENSDTRDAFKVVDALRVALTGTEHDTEDLSWALDVLEVAVQTADVADAARAYIEAERRYHASPDFGAESAAEKDMAAAWVELETALGLAATPAEDTP